MYTSTKQVNQAFRQFARENHIPVKRGKPQNLQPCDTRMAYCDFVESLYMDGQISDRLRDNATYF